MKIAFKPNPKRGKEIISLLESLGGVNSQNLSGKANDVGFLYYYIKNGIIRFQSCSKEYKIYTLEEFEKEFPFKVGDIVQTKPYGEPAEIIRLYPNPACTIAYKVRYTSGVEMLHSPDSIKFYKEMNKEERNITLTLDKAKEWYKKGGDLKQVALQAFSENELNPLPRSWEEYIMKYEACCFSTRYTNILLKYDALLKLKQLRDCWRQGWKPTKHDTGYCIIHYPEEYLIMSFCFISFLSFPTKEMAKEFLECFRDLIEKAGDLI